MKLLEYEAKSILNESDVTTPKSFVAGDNPEFLPVVLKSQVPTGGRGKAGGIVIARSSEEYASAKKTLRGLEIKGFLPKTLLAEELLAIDKEFYLSVLIDKKSSSLQFMAHTNGGVEVEENAANSYWNMATGEDFNPEIVGQSLADYYDLPDKTFVLQDLVEKLYDCFVKNDATLLEINPLVVTKEGRIVAGDCKMELDDAAAFRHPDWDFETGKSEVNFVTLNPDGNVATIANGAGLAMATVDAAHDAGLVPANFLDIGGGANKESVLAAFQRLVQYPNIRVIIINIFAGITRCDEVVKAIIAAREQLPNLPPLAVRLAGTNYEQAAALLAQHSITIQPSLADAMNAAKQEIS